MNYKDYSKIQRLLGVIEGAAFGMKDFCSKIVIQRATEAINKVLERNVKQEG